MDTTEWMVLAGGIAAIVAVLWYFFAGAQDPGRSEHSHHEH